MNNLPPEVARAGLNRSAALKRLIIRTIRAEGPLPFDRFVDFALYAPELGYYQWHAPGDRSVYRTSPSLTPAFGRLVCRQLEQMWAALGNPSRFSVVEAGAGSGDLAHAAISAADDDFKQALEWCFVEPMPRIQGLQQGRLAGLKSPISWVQSLDELDCLKGAVLANEVLDNFPFQVFEVSGNKVAEVRVGIEDQQLAEVLFEENDPRLTRHPATAHLETGDRFEVRRQLDDWVHRAAKVIEAGFLLIVDYGDVEPNLWASRPAGTMLTYRDGELGVDPFADVGSRDITAHVNFSALERAAVSEGMSVTPLQSQRTWLHSLGLDRLVDQTRREQCLAESTSNHHQALSLMAERGRLVTLVAKGGLGDLKVFLAAKSVALPAEKKAP